MDEKYQIMLEFCVKKMLDNSKDDVTMVDSLRAVISLTAAVVAEAYASNSQEPELLIMLDIVNNVWRNSVINNG